MAVNLDRFFSPSLSRLTALFDLRRGPAIAFLLTMLIASPAVAQDPNPTQDVPDPNEALFTEYQQLQGRLGQLQVQAIQENGELETRRTEIDEMLMAAMIEINPETEAHIARLEVLSEEAIVAQQAQNVEALQPLMAEAMGLRSELENAQAQAIELEHVQAEIQSFETDLMAKTVEIDPEATELLTRMEELAELLSVGGPGDF